MTEPVGQSRGMMGNRVFFSWLVVMIPIGYGIYMTVKSVSPLFG
jgi:hypothetical protein